MIKQLKAISLKCFHCQQWTLQQEYLIACKRINYSDKCGTHLDAHREWGSSLPPMYKTPISIWVSHTHIWGNKRTIVHTLANLRDLAELLFQNCQIVSQGTWCKCFKTCPCFTVSKGGLAIEEGVLVLWWGKHLSLLPPQCLYALHTLSTLWFL